MGIFEKIFKKPRADIATSGYFKMLNGYSPVFSSAPESVYEMELTRTAIHSFATFCAKLKPDIQGGAKANLAKALQYRPNPLMDTYKFIYRIATILEIHNTCFIVPIEDEFGTVEGFYPLVPLHCEVVEHNKEPYLRYTFGNGQKAAIELSRVGIMTKFQHKSDLFGESNGAIRPTMQLIQTQNDAIVNSVRNSASVRFLAKVANILKSSAIKEERDRFAKENLSSDNTSGMIIYDNKFEDLKPIESKPFIIDAEQVEHINRNVYSYFGTNEKILQNSYSEDEWNAYYEGKIEPFAIQLSLVLSNMIYSERELAHGNSVIFSANRLQYASNKSKLDISTQLFDRGLLNRNQIMDIWNLAHVEDGDKYYIRREYAEINEIGKEEAVNVKESTASGVQGDESSAVGAVGKEQQI